jgi:tetratricopeptide (TPR) repeat protein
MTFLCVAVTGGYLAAVTYWFAVTPSRTLGLKTDSFFRILYVEQNSPASRAGILPGETVDAINGLPPQRLSFFKLALTGLPEKPVALTIALNGGAPHSASMILRSPLAGWILPLLALGSLLCALISLVLNYRHPAPTKDPRKTVGWIVAAAVLPLFLACALALISIFANLPMWVFLVLGLPGGLAPILFFCAMGIRFDTDTVAWRNIVLGAVMFFPLPLLVAIHVAHPGKETDSGDLITDLGIDYLEALGMLLLIVGLFIALCWCFRPKRGYMMLPLLTADDKEFNGQAVSEELAAELQRIDNAQQKLRELYQRWFRGDSPASPRTARKDKSKLSKETLLAASRVSEISAARMAPQPSVGEIATFKVGEKSLSIGQYFSDLKTFWSATDPKGVFTGSIRRYSSEVLVVVSFKGDEGRPSLWSARRKVGTERTCSEFSHLLRELAFEIYLDIEENPPCTTREALREYTEAIFQLNIYFETRDKQRASKALSGAVYSFKQALKAEAFGGRMSPMLPILLSRTCLVRGQMSHAEELSENAIGMLPEAGEEPESAAAWWLRGILHYRQGRFLAAEKSFRLALNSDPKFEDGWRDLAWLMLEMHRRRDAVKAIGQLADCVRDRLMSTSLNERKVEEEKQRNKGLRKEIILVDLFNEFRLKCRARAQCQAAARKWRSDTAILIRLGGLLVDCGKEEEALKIYDAARKRAPKLFEIYNEIGNAYVGLNKLDKAAEYYRKSGTLQHQSGVPYLNLGRIYRNQNNFTAARAEFLKAIAAEPQLAVAYSNLGFALYEMKRYDEAQEALQLGLQPDESGLVIFESEIHNLLGDICLRKDKTDEALAEFKRAVQFDPDWSDPHRLLGYTYRNTGDLNSALAEFNIAQKLDPNELDTFHGAGGVLRQMKRMAEAVEEYKKAIELNTRDAYAHIALAACYEDLGQAELSAECKKRAVNIGDSQIESRFDRACFWALAGNRKQALQFLAEAFRAGETTEEQAVNDIDLALVHGDADFAALVLESHRPGDSSMQAAVQGRTP